LEDTRGEYQHLFDVYWPVGVGVFVVVLVAVVFVVLRFRSASDEFPRGRDSSRVGEGLYALGIAGIVAFLVALTFDATSDIDSGGPGGARAASGTPLEVRVTAAKWNWRFDYPAQRVTERGSDLRPATLYVPVDTPVHFTQTSRDVIHSFWIPYLRFKRDAFPERTTTFTLTFGDRGFHQQQGECAEFCGLRHTHMDFNVSVVDRADFDRWARDRAGGGPR
jgi:cytochrome c oxidase subunit II